MHCNCTAGLLVLGTTLCGAQTNVTPRVLLEELAASARGAQAWRAEGVETGELTGEGMNLHTETAFKAAFRDSSHVRWETTGDTRTLMVCDGVDRWTYAEPGTGFYRVPVEAGPCRPGLPAMDEPLDNLVSATFVGGDHIPFEGVSRDCDIIRAEYRIPAGRAGSPVSKTGAGTIAGTTIIRTLCVDPARRLILRDRTESWATGSNTRFTRTITFSSYDRGVEIPDEAFRFEVPTGTLLDPGPQIDEGDTGGVSRPQLIRKVEPSWTEEARQAGISGLVLVSLTVDAEGQPQNLTVTRKLGHGLDENALETVRQWQFRASLKDGTPVAVGNLTVAVDFRLP
jgi:TonB family protein